MSKRLIPVNKKEAKKLKLLIKKAKNNTETKRIWIVIQYLGGSNMNEVSNALQVSGDTVRKVVNKYKIEGDNYYRTNYKGRQENEKHKKLAEQVKKIIELEENVDIIEVKRKLEKINGEEYGYEKIHWLVRKKLGYNYQKPFVTSNQQSEYAKEIAEGRLRKGLYQIAMEEGEIDAESVQNKKI